LVLSIVAATVHAGHHCKLAALLVLNGQLTDVDLENYFELLLGVYLRIN